MNKFILMKCIALGALSFPTPFLIFFYLWDYIPPTFMDRFYLVIFLILSGGLVGVVSYYKDPIIGLQKDWGPGKKNQ